MATPFLTQLLASQSPKTTSPSFLLPVIMAGPLPGRREPPPPSESWAAFCSPLWLPTSLRARVCAEHLHEEIKAKCFYSSGPLLERKDLLPGEAGLAPGLSISLPGSPPVSEGCPPPQTGHWALFLRTTGSQQGLEPGRHLDCFRVGVQGQERLQRPGGPGGCW